MRRDVTLRSLVHEIVLMESESRSFSELGEDWNSADTEQKIVPYVEEPPDLARAAADDERELLHMIQGHMWPSYMHTHEVEGLAREIAAMDVPGQVKSDARDVLAAMACREQMENLLNRSWDRPDLNLVEKMGSILRRGLSYLRPVLERNGTRESDSSANGCAAVALETLAWIDADAGARTYEEEFSNGVISPFHELCAAAVRGLKETARGHLPADPGQSQLRILRRIRNSDDYKLADLAWRSEEILDALDSDDPRVVKMLSHPDDRAALYRNLVKITDDRVVERGIDDQGESMSYTALKRAAANVKSPALRSKIKQLADSKKKR